MAMREGERIAQSGMVWYDMVYPRATRVAYLYSLAGRATQSWER